MMNAFIDIQQIINIANIALLVLFILVIALVVFSMLWALLRNWKFGTYRLICMSVFILAAVLTLNLLTKGLGQITSPVTFTISVTVNGTYCQATFGQFLPVLTQFLEDILKALNSSVDPSSITGYAMSLAISILSCVIFSLEMIIIVFILNPIFNLFWHVLWVKVFTPKRLRNDKREKRRLNWIAMLEEGLIAIVCVALLYAPLTSTVNSLSGAWSSTSVKAEQRGLKKADNDTVQLVDSIVKAYEDSVFAQAFFSWNRDAQTGKTFDQNLMAFIAGVDYQGGKLDAFSELANFGSMASIVVQSGMINTSGEMAAANYASFFASGYMPMLLDTLSNTQIVTNLLPTGLTLLMNLDAVKEQIAINEGLNFYDVDFSSSLKKLSSLWDEALATPALSRIYYQEGDDIPEGYSVGDVKRTGDLLQGFFASDSAEKVHHILSELSSDDLSFVDTILQAYLVTQALKAKNNPPAEGSNIALTDFLPALPEDIDSDGDGVADRVPEDYKAIQAGHELVILYDSFVDLNLIDPNLLSSFTNTLNGGSSGIDGNAFMDTMLNHVSEVGPIFYGNPADAEDTCLLDSVFILNGASSLMKMVGNTMNDSMGLSGEDRIDLNPIIENLDSGTQEQKRAKYKDEFRGLFGVLEGLTSNEEGKTFFRHISDTPGMYKDPENSNLVGMDPNLLTAFVNGTSALDNTQIGSAILRKMIVKFLSEGSALFGDGFVFGNDCPNLGHEISSFLASYRDHQDMVSTLIGVTGSGFTGNQGAEKLKAFAAYEDDLAAFLADFAGNAFFNPDVGGLHNQNFYSLLSMLFASTLGEDFHAAEVKAVLDESTPEDFADLAHGFMAMATSNLISAISGGGGFALSSLTDVSFETFFGAIGNSKILRVIFQPILDNRILNNDTFRSDEAPLSFNNVEDWASEGRVIDYLIRFAAEYGDLSNIDFLSSDPESIAGLIATLSQSSLFVDADTHEYLFSKFIASKFIGSFASMGDAASFFTNPGADIANGSSATAYEEEDFSYFKADLLEIDRAGWIDESQAIGDLLLAATTIGGFDSFSAASDFRSYELHSFEGLFRAAEASRAFGPIALYHVHEKINEMIQGSGASYVKANVQSLYSDAGVKAPVASFVLEDNAVLSLLAMIIDPTGKDGMGNPKYPLLDGSGAFTSFTFFGANAIRAEVVVNLLLPIANSNIYNGTRISDGAGHPALSAFEQDLADKFAASNIYGGGYDFTKIEEYVADTVALATTNEERYAIWSSEIRILGSLVRQVKELGIDFDAGMDFRDLLADPSTRDENRDRIEKMLLDYNESGPLYRSLPIQIENALGSANFEVNGVVLDLSRANYDYMNGDRYERIEIRNLVDIFYYFSLMNYNLELAPATLMGDTPQRRLLHRLKEDRLLNTVKPGETQTVLDPIKDMVVAFPGGSAIWDSI